MLRWSIWDCVWRNWKCMEELQGVKWCVSQEAEFYLRSNGGRFISVVLDQFCCTVVKRGNLPLQELILVDVIGGYCCEDQEYDNSKPSAVVWSCNAWRHQFPNRWDYGSWNNWEKEEGSTKEKVGRVHKERFGQIRLEMRRCVWLKETARAHESKNCQPCPFRIMTLKQTWLLIIFPK